MDSIPNWKEDPDECVKYFNKYRNPEETQKLYDDWSAKYEEDIVTMDYSGLAKFADIVASTGIPKDAKILDVGCGTGMFGNELSKRGYTNIYGLDGSSGMLEVARSRNLYKGLEQRLLYEGVKTSFEDGTFDMVVSCGAILPGHIGPEAFPELVRVIKKGGLLVWLDSKLKPEYDAEMEDFRKKYEMIIDELVQKGKLKRREDVEFKNYYLTVDGIAHTLEVL